MAATRYNGTMKRIRVWAETIVVRAPDSVVHLNTRAGDVLLV